MTWTYDLTLLATSELFQVRMLIGDTDSTKQMLQDEEIGQLLVQYGNNIYLAAAAACRAIAAKLSKEADQKTGKIATWLTSRVKWYLQAAEGYEALASTTNARGYGGGISLSDKANQEADTDWAQTYFKRGMMDNTT